MIVSAKIQLKVIPVRVVFSIPTATKQVQERVKMKIIKRSGVEAAFDITKILAAVTKANNVVAEDKRLSKEQIEKVGAKLREMMPWISKGKMVDKARN